MSYSTLSGLPIIEGTTDGDTVEQLLKQPDLTLEMATSMCKAQEAAKNSGEK